MKKEVSSAKVFDSSYVTSNHFWCIILRGGASKMPIVQQPQNSGRLFARAQLYFIELALLVFMMHSTVMVSSMNPDNIQLYNSRFRISKAL